MKINELEASYKNLLSDELYDKLLLRTQEPNIFRVLGIADYEIRHSNFLGWLLDPHETHGLGDLFLQRFLQEVLIDERAQNISIIELSKLNLSEVEIRREWKNIDILIITENFTVCIENKIWSNESKGQLMKYKNIIDSEFPNRKSSFVFLNPTGYESSKNDIYISYSYAKIIEILNFIVKSRGSILNPSVLIYIKNYLTILKQNVMSDDATNDWARKLYLNHQDFFEFVFQNKPDVLYDFAEVLNQKIKEKGWLIGSKNKGYTRFYTEKIAHLIPKYNKANGWPQKEAFLFEFDFYYANRITFKTVISPPVEFFSYDKRLVEILGELEGVNPNLGGKWKSHFITGFPWDIKKVMFNWNDKYEKKLDDFFNQIEEIVIKVETQILKYESELLVLKKEINPN